MTKEKNDRIPPIGKFKPSKRSTFVEADSKNMVAHFSKLYGTENISALEKFTIQKISYDNQLDQICKHINFFEYKYDTDHELMLAYLKIKYEIDYRKRFRIPIGSTQREIDKHIRMFVPYMYEIIFKETNIVQHIEDFVEENYLDDINSTNNANDTREYLESLEFTNDHIKLMLKISMGMRLISPVIFHYFFVNGVKTPKYSDRIYLCYRNLFDDVFDTHGVNIFNKLFVYVKSKVISSFKQNQKIVDKREIFGEDVSTTIASFIRNCVISENMVKFAFPSTWDEKHNQYKENTKGFVKVIVNKQLQYYMKEVYAKNLTEVSSAKNTDGLSGADKMEMNIAKMDEGKALLAELNVEMAIKRIKKTIDIPVENWEIDYLDNYWNPSPLQISLITLYYSEYFGNIRDTILITRRELIYLALLLKKKLLLENGWCKGDGVNGQPIKVCIPYILTGKFEGRHTTRQIRNAKYLNDLENDPYYQELQNGELKYVLIIHKDEIRSIISEIIGSNFTYITPEDRELLGTLIPYNETQVGSELLQFLHSAVSMNV